MRHLRQLAFAAVMLLIAAVSFSQDAHSTPPRPAPVQFEQETLANGMRVIYAPLHTAPVVHVRVLYHVGSKDERPDRQGFAHMFEHMMFRGSANVAPEQHMKLIGDVGGNSNAFTSFDQTVYINTLPASHLDMALWLEADRMASFKVTDEIYKIERKVVAEEWRTRRNQPYGTMFEKVLEALFTKHSYRWAPIGNMDHLAAAPVSDLQEFFNKYYVPNNAILVVAGDFQIDEARKLVKRYYEWIPRGPDVKRNIPQEDPQTEAKRVQISETVPLPAVGVIFKAPPYASRDADILDIVGRILGNGGSSRLNRELVVSANPVAMQAFPYDATLEDVGVFGVAAITLAGKKVEDVEAGLNKVLDEVRANGVTQEELAKAKTQIRIGIIRGRETAEALASQLGSEALLTGDPSRVNDLDRIESITLDDINRAIKDYLRPEQATTAIVTSDVLAAMTGKGRKETDEAVKRAAEGAVAPSTEPVEARVISFPDDYPTTPPQPPISSGRPFEKGVENDINGIRTIVMHDSRLPLVSWSLTMRRGSHSDPQGKKGLAELTTDLVGRGAAGMAFPQWAEDLESRGISLSVSDGGDITRISGSCTTDQLGHAVLRCNQLLTQPNLDKQEFEKLKAQSISGLMVDLETPEDVADREIATIVYGDSVFGRHPTPASLGSITHDNVKAFFQAAYRPEDAILVIAGDITLERSKEVAEKLLSGWKPQGQQLPAVDYSKLDYDRELVVIDHPGAKQAAVRMGMPTYSIQSEDKFAGAVANRILTGGIDSRLQKYVRAEKGLAYSTYGVFSPSRQAGEFNGGTATAIETAVDAVQAMFHVIDKMRQEHVTEQELKSAQTRVAGGMLMQLQTIAQQAQYRVDGILNGYPIDYYDKYPERIAQITAEQVREVMQKYIDTQKLSVLIVAPASAVSEKMKQIGEVDVKPMPTKRDAPAHAPASQPAAKELLKKAA